MHPARQHTACTPCQARLLLIWPGLARREEEKKKRTEVEAICGKYQVERDAALEAKGAALKAAERLKLAAQRAYALSDESAAARLRAEKAARATRSATSARFLQACFRLCQFQMIGSMVTHG